MKPFYSDMATHCLRFYARHRDPRFRSDADKKNWYASENALKSYDDKDRSMLIEVYAEGDAIPDNVHRVAKRYGVKTDTVWSKIHDLERRVAKRRGLI